MHFRELRKGLNSGNKKEVKSCLRAAGGSEYTFLCSLAVVCLCFFSLLGVCVVPFLGQIRPTPHTPLSFLKHRRRGMKKNKVWAVSFIFLVLLKRAFTVVISYGFVTSSLCYVFMWCVPAKFTHELLFFLKKSSLSQFSLIRELWYPKGVVVLPVQSTYYIQTNMLT